MPHAAQIRCRPSTLFSKLYSTSLVQFMFPFDVSLHDDTCICWHWSTVRRRTINLLPTDRRSHCCTFHDLFYFNVRILAHLLPLFRAVVCDPCEIWWMWPCRRHAISIFQTCSAYALNIGRIVHMHLINHRRLHAINADWSLGSGRTKLAGRKRTFATVAAWVGARPDRICCGDLVSQNQFRNCSANENLRTMSYGYSIFSNIYDIHALSHNNAD